MSLAVKYRPTTFEDVVEQSITTTILKRQLETRSFKNAYGFFGASGCGKTTCARIFANLINHNLGYPIEIDAGSLISGDASGAENIRKLMDASKQRDLISEYKVIILDEAHNIGNKTNPAWAAMLKTLEECPKYTIFILCSTDPEKIPEAILNRLQRYTFAPISSDGIKSRLKYICQQEGFTNYEDTCDLISKSVSGGMRDAITYLEQASDYSTNLSKEVAESLFSGLSYASMCKLTWAIEQKDEKQIISIIEDLFNCGQNLKTFISVYTEFILNIIKFILFQNINVTNIPERLASQDNPVIQSIVSNNSIEYFNNLVETLLDIKCLIKTDESYKTTIIIKLITFIRG